MSPRPRQAEDPGESRTIARWGAACAECTKNKSKCNRPNGSTSTDCERCQRLGKICREKVQKPRKKREAKGSKTKQLEERLDNLVRSLYPANSATSLSLDESATTASDSVSPNFHPATQNSTSIFIPPTYNSFGPQSCICRSVYGEVPGSIDSDETLLNIYRNDLVTFYPFVIIPESITAQDLHETRPFLMSCIRMVASFRSLSSMYGQMFQLKTYVTEHMIMRSERSLDLLAGLVVMLGWHHYHCVVHTQMHNLVSLACSMVADLGLKRHPGWQERTELMVQNLGEVRERSNEQKRLLLAAWYLSSSISVNLQQLDPMPFTPYMERCLHDLEAEKEYETDANLIQLIRIQNLAGRVAKSVEDNTGDRGTMKAHLSLYTPAFEHELNTLCEQMPEHIFRQNCIKVQIDTIRVRLHEPPRLSPSLVSEIAATTLQPSMVSNVPSYLDSFYKSAAAIKTWYEDWFELPVKHYYAIPMPIALHVIYAITTTGRWAKMFTPGAVNFLHQSSPEDPSGSYNDRSAPDKMSSLSRNMHKLATTLSTPTEDELVKAIIELNKQLSSQPGLKLDVMSLLKQLGSNMEQASAGLAAQSIDPPNVRFDIWSLTAIKLRIAQRKLENWTEKVIYKECQSNHEEADNQNNLIRNYMVDNRKTQPDSTNSTSTHDYFLNESWIPNDMTNDFDTAMGSADSSLWMGWDQDWGAIMLGQIDPSSFS